VKTLSLAFSPDSDDIFMFLPLLRGDVDTEGLSFRHERADTETLNGLAAKGEVDVIALSIATYAKLTGTYVLMGSGASVGRGYGPVVVSTQGGTLADYKGKRIGIPGHGTTAAMVLRLLLPEFEPVVIPISPYSLTFDALRRGEVDAALLIHEGRLTYEKEGFALVADVGVGFGALTGGLPIALGGNAIRKGLGAETVQKIARLCKRSIAWALEHREAMMDALLAEETRGDVTLDRALLDRYLAMYANADTLNLPDDARRGIVELFRRAHQAGLLPSEPTVEFADG
jgi:1,4-dihydroxy-6-naphthoate synthase